VGMTRGSISVELVPKDSLGSRYGIIGMVRGLSRIFSPLISGIIWKTLGLIYVLNFLAITQILKLSSIDEA
jgi:hypothetical protein